MQRTNFKGKSKKSVSAILCADFHLREDTPICRTDNFWKAQWDKVDDIKQMQKAFQVPVIHAGDMFHHWKPSPFLLSTTIQHLPDQFWTIYGQHDLPQHNLDLSMKSGVNTLLAAGKLNLLKGYHWGQSPDDDNLRYSFRFFQDRKIAIWHHLTYQTKPFPGATGGMAKGILKKYPQFDIIVTGDNHKTFVEEYEGRILVNPGSLTRQTSDQINHRPCVFLYYAKTNTVEEVLLNYEDDVISREHIEKTERRDERIEAFISKLDTDWEAEMSFEENLERFAEKNNIRPEIMDIIYKAIEA